MRKREMKICLTSSSGGHLSQIFQLIPIVKEYSYFFITEKNMTTASLRQQHKVYYLQQQERKNLFFLFVFLRNIWLSLLYVWKEKPSVVISTGAGATFPVCLFGKLMGAQIIFIESFAKVHSPTITGRMVYPLADRFYIQSQGLKKFYPKAEYKGGIY
ncbi:PssD/Cps14F family polysaccharide biosynthesis glycosyltransferase [Bacillus sp. DX4.1]|uniref:PssD/Cps14F family polysaccharide biosynthesis glycosyltransferase n=1 Tax=Bacillus sp. DX4.1 TaxID=3055867 RepID=UPI0025A2D17F|nr:PssD/Cps14F family polysaccharide biosynthesis glycosyltransferase [Bacillus sp. DX4.1]MDM5187901.1 PssD/Cps14F family polysaccharide biosynthesis glycosyltransferase [Bacillus sp. DX4.1]